MSAHLVPHDFAALVRGYPAQGHASGQDWIDRLPRLLADLLEGWRLEPVGPTRSGACAVAVPVRPLDGTHPDSTEHPAGRERGAHRDGAVLKVTWPHPEAATESLALQVWDGHGAVRLLRADPARFALLLERAGDQDLSTEPIDDACAVIGDLLAQLRNPGHPRLTTLADLVTDRAALLASAPPVIPRRYLDQAVGLATDLAAEVTGRPAGDAELDATLHTDLHYANVLAARRSPWLAIDPKPVRGDRGYEVAPALWNRADELGTGSQVRRSLRRRLQIVCEHAGIDQDRARAWTVVREAVTAAEAVRSGPDTPGRDSRARVSLAVTIIKAMND